MLGLAQHQLAVDGAAGHQALHAYADEPQTGALQAEATDVTVEIHRAVTRLYDALGLQRARVRLVGVRVEGLLPRERVHRQLVLGEREHGWHEADRAVDRAVHRFGSAAVGPASLLG